MNVSYYGYYLHDSNSGRDYRADLTALMDHFASNATMNFKKNLQYNGEGIYPLTLASPAYYLIQSRDREVIKSVARASLRHQNISVILGNANSVGFASYVYFQDCWLAMVTKVLSPRINALGHAINQFLRELGSDLQFCITPLTDQLRRQDIVTLNQVGAVSMGVDANTGIGQAVINALSGNGFPMVNDIGEIEVRIKPARRRSNLRPLLQRVIGNIPEGDINELDIRGKVEAADRMRDMYIYGSGGIKDNIQVRNERDIPATIAAVSNANASLTRKAREFRNDRNFIQVANLSDIGVAW